MALKGLTTVSFLIMIIVNALANIIPINGVTTGQVSNLYENLFAPAGYTFAIWGLIYFLLAGYTLYQFGLFHKNKSAAREELFQKIGPYYRLSSMANAFWIFSWHHFNIGSSMILMISILICLILIVHETRKVTLSICDKIFIQLPFSIYFGWITVATIANATTYLVSIGWNGFGLSESTWAVIIILVGLAIGIATIAINMDVIYGFTIIWGYIGILIKHISASGFAGMYRGVINTVIISIIVLLVTIGYVITGTRRDRK